MPSSATSPSSSPTLGSGIVSTPTGDRHIPPSTRADGSLRKEIKIRPGYRPPEDVQVYKNRTAEAWKTRGTSGVPGAEGLESAGVSEDKGGAAGKNAKRREARKRAKASERDGDGDESEQIEGASGAASTNQPTVESKLKTLKDWRADAPTAKEPEAQLESEAEKEKLARNLKKKLRQARELREKKAKGENLLPEQFEKVIKMQELIRQLDSLGFDSDGVRKAEDVQ